ncbi:MAG: PaaI family thioesterase [Desulfuromonadaceae bacterium]|nr:PaaI family thioesterase [Desulfuromonadaceae bacterium]
MQIVDDGRCFICGKENPVGLRVVFAVDPERRRAETHVRIRDDFQGWQGITHGGIISALLDEICAQACMCCGIPVVTSEIKIRYRAPVPTGSLVTVIGEVIGERRRLVDAKGRLELDGKIMAEAEVTLFRSEQLQKS